MQAIADAHPQRLSFVTEMVGHHGIWRARKGDYRAVYAIEGDTMTVVAVDIGRTCTNDADTIPKPISTDAHTVTIRRQIGTRMWPPSKTRAISNRSRSIAPGLSRSVPKRRSASATPLPKPASMLDGQSALATWRNRAGLTQRALATAAEISPSYLAEIEAGKKPGSAAAIRAVARVLNVPMEMLV